MATTLCQKKKCWPFFCQKAQKFVWFWTIGFYSNFTSMWSKYFSNNVWSDFKILMSASAVVTLNVPSENHFFEVNLPFKLFRATVANADIVTLKTLFDKYVDHVLVKFEQNRMIQTTRSFEFLIKNRVFITNFDKELTLFWKMFL